MVGTRGSVLAVAGVLAACSGGDARTPAARPAPAPVGLAEARADSIRGGAVLTLEDLETAAIAEGPAPDPAPGPATAPAATAEPAPAAVELPRLPAAMAEALSAPAFGLALDPKDELAIAFEEQPGDVLPLLLGSTSVMDEDTVGREMTGPVPAAPEEQLQ